MSTLADNPRKVNLWQLLSTTTGYSKVYCRKVIQGERNADAKGAKRIIEKYNRLSKLLSDETEESPEKE
jgi:cyanate lyase